MKLLFQEGFFTILGASRCVAASKYIVQNSSYYKVIRYFRVVLSTKRHKYSNFEYASFMPVIELSIHFSLKNSKKWWILGRVLTYLKHFYIEFLSRLSTVNLQLIMFVWAALIMDIDILVYIYSLTLCIYLHIVQYISEISKLFNIKQG